jgi:CheY-like chemotaxis protein
MARPFQRETAMRRHAETMQRVLVADDDLSVRHLVGTIIRREGLEVDCVSDGVEAVRHLENQRYAVVLLDLMMPRLDGFGVVDYLRAQAIDPKPVVLVITAYADQRFKQVDPAIVAGVLRKPFEVADLGQLVRLCVETYTEAVRKRTGDVASEQVETLALRRWSTTRSA